MPVPVSPPPKSLSVDGYVDDTLDVDDAVVVRIGNRQHEGEMDPVVAHLAEADKHGQKEAEQNGKFGDAEEDRCGEREELPLERE